ncbi:MAG: DUF2189 domain-containing protein [Gammaproteobacteria bacterium]|nr:DUF2189 domain-containing protein [Gammaproteobacteria bacterium]
MTSTPPSTHLAPTRLRFSDIGFAIATGLSLLHTLPRVSVAYAAVFATLGLALLTVLGMVGLSPMALPFAGGFMLVGPILLAGYFELVRLHESGIQPTIGDPFRAFARAPAGLWLLAVLCAFLFVIWITDAGILYSFTIGETDLGYDLAWLPQQGRDVLTFELWGALMGSVLAYLIFTVSAFSVPLVYEGRAGLVQGISASARVVLGNFLVCLAWGITLGSVIVLSILVMPVLLFTLPVMSYASFALYRRAFPDRQETP